MACRVSTENQLGGFTLSSSPTQATGYTATDAFNGNPGKVARTSSSGTGKTYIWDRGGGAGSLALLAAVFGIRSVTLGPSNIASVTWYDNSGASLIGAAALATAGLDSRGDAWDVFTTTQRYLLLSVVLSSADSVDFGEAWAGPYNDLTRGPIAPLPRQVDYATLANDAVDGSVYTSQQSDYLESFSFQWGALTSAQANEILGVFHAAKGRLNPVVVVPDTGSAEVFHGHFTNDRLPREVDAPVVRGLSLELRQSGRVLYG